MHTSRNLAKDIAEDIAEVAALWASLFVVVAMSISLLTDNAFGDVIGLTWIPVAIASAMHALVRFVLSTAETPGDSSTTETEGNENNESNESNESNEDNEGDDCYEETNPGRAWICSDGSRVKPGHMFSSTGKSRGG